MHTQIRQAIAEQTPRRRRRHGFLVAFAIAASTIVAPAAAQAAPYDNTDPSHTGCSASGRTVTSRTITDSRGGPLALLELRWSTACQTNWTKMTSLRAGARVLRAYIDRPSPFARLTFAGTYSSLYTNQLYGGPGTSCLFSSGWVQDPYTGFMTYAETGCY